MLPSPFTLTTIASSLLLSQRYGDLFNVLCRLRYSPCLRLLQRYGDLGTSAEAIGYGATEATAAPEHGKRSATKAFFSKGHLSTRGAGGPVADAL